MNCQSTPNILESGSWSPRHCRWGGLIARVFLYCDRSVAADRYAAWLYQPHQERFPPFIRGLLCRTKHESVGTRLGNATIATGICGRLYSGNCGPAGLTIAGDGRVVAGQGDTPQHSQHLPKPGHHSSRWRSGQHFPQETEGERQTFLVEKVILGFVFAGKAGSQRTVGLTREKASSYLADIRSALDCPQRYISKSEFQKLHGWLNHASQVMPCMGGFMLELNQMLASTHITVGLGMKAPLQCTIEDFADMLGFTHDNLSHIAEVVGTELPHIYGYTDACRQGMDGVILPVLEWLPSTVSFITRTD
jgi:hypothetical protein